MANQSDALEELRTKTLEWKNFISKEIDEMNRKSQDILSNLNKELGTINGIMENHWFTDELFTPIINLYRFVNNHEIKRTDSEEIKYKIEKCMESYKLEMLKHLENLKCNNGFDLLNQSVDKLIDINEQQYDSLKQEFKF